MKRIFYLALIVSIVSSSVKAQIPQTISYQGFYTDASGVPVNDTGTESHTVNFYFFKGDAADTSFSRTITKVVITKGLFGVTIGRNLTISDGSKNKPLPANIWHDPYNVQIGVDALPTGDKIPLTTVPYAMTAASVPAANLTGTNTLPSSVLPTTVPIGNGVNGNLAVWTGSGTVGNDTDLAWSSGTNTLSAANFSGNGALLTSLTAANITGTNTLPAAVLPTTVPIGNGVADNLTFWTGAGTVGNDADLTWNSSTNTLSATNFSGNFSGVGSTLSVPAANLTGTNTLPAAVLPTTVPVGNGVTGNLTFWTGTGTVGNDADLSWIAGTNTLNATNFSGNGSSITSLTAANIIGTNTLPATVLPTTVPIGNGVTDNLTLWTGTGTVGNDVDLTWNSSTNTLSATNFSGNFSGSGSTLSVPAANLTGTNTLPAAVLPTTVPLGNGATGNLTFWTGSGTVGNDTDLSWNLGSNTLTASNFAGNGSGLTSLTAASLTGANTLPAGVLPTAVPLGNGATNNLTIWTGTGSVGNDTDLSWNTGSNTLSATNFSGNGSLLTSLTAANITGTNTLPATVLPTTVPIGNGAINRVTFWTGTGGVGSDADISWNSTTNVLTATNFSGNGSALTSLTAGNLTGTNTLPASVLPTTVPIGNGVANRVPIWTGTGTVSSNTNLTWDNTNSRLGIGSTAPTTSLYVRHGNGVGTQGISIENSTTGNPWSFYVSSSDELWLVYGGAEKGEFSPVSGSYTAVSDRRMKKDLQPMGSILPELLRMKAHSYLFTAGPASAQRSIGFIAQEVKEVFPEIVNYSAENDLHTLDYSALGVLAIKAIQEQQELIEELREEIKELRQILNVMKDN